MATAPGQPPFNTPMWESNHMPPVWKQWFTMAWNELVGLSKPAPFDSAAFTVWFHTLPTAQPGTPGWWNNAGVLTFS